MFETMAERRNVKYSSVPTDESASVAAESLEDKRYAWKPQENVPWKSIRLALFLLSFGAFCLIFATLLLTEHMGGDKSQGYGFLAIGLLVFIPGKCLNTKSRVAQYIPLLTHIFHE